MAVTTKVLCEATVIALDPATTTMYTAPSGTVTIIDKLTVTNYSASSATVVVYIIPSGGSVIDANALVKKTLASKEVYTCPEIVGHNLATGDAIVSNADAVTAVSLRASGREVT